MAFRRRSEKHNELLHSDFSGIVVGRTAGAQVTAGNGIYNVTVYDLVGSGGVGAYRVKTGASHPAGDGVVIFVFQSLAPDGPFTNSFVPAKDAI
ncbi:hypothetical protein L0222_14820 [bacterium]|nr:hypothetical protein [bacterium]MCI0603679.1 hypothetical protein [bacterium]